MNCVRSSRDWLARIISRLPTWLYIAVSLIFLLLVAGWLAARTWDWLQSGGIGLEESNSTTLRNVGLLIGAVIAGILAIWRSSVAEKQATAARLQATVAQTQANIAQESLRHDRYQRGAEMLGSEILSVRLGGIYALQRLAEEYPEDYHIQVMELLCAFVRTPTEKGRGDSSYLGHEDDAPLREDVQAVMTALGKRSAMGKSLEEEQGFILDLHGADLTGVDLSDYLHEPDFQYADLTGAKLAKADLEGTCFAGAKLNGAKLTRAYCRGTEFKTAALNEAQMDRIDAEYAFFNQAFLLNVDFSHACLKSVDFGDAIFCNVNLTGTNIKADPNHPDRVTSLTQEQLDQCWSAPDTPPSIAEFAFDHKTGKPLAWNNNLSPESN